MVHYWCAYLNAKISINFISAHSYLPTKYFDETQEFIRFFRFIKTGKLKLFETLSTKNDVQCITILYFD